MTNVDRWWIWFLICSIIRKVEGNEVGFMVLGIAALVLFVFSTVRSDDVS